MPSRRAVLRSVGIGGLTVTSGCTAFGALRRHVHHEDAPVDEAAGPWPTFGATSSRTGAVPAASSPPAGATVREVARLGRFADAQPVVERERAYVGVDRLSTEAGAFTGLLALDLGGERPEATTAWRASEGDASVAFTPTARGSVVYAQVGRGVKALDAATADVYWRTTAGGLAPTVDGPDCFTADDGVIALDAVTGETRWRSEATDNAPSGLAVTDDAVCLTCGDGGQGALWAFDRSDGTTRWRYADVGESYATAVTDGDRVYAVSTGGRLHAVGLADGERRWTHRLEGESYIQPAVANGTVYLAGSNGDWLFALDAATGDPQWERRLGVGGQSPPAVTGESVLVVTGTRDGERLFVLDRTTGRERSRYELPRGLYDAVQPVVGDGVAYVVAEPAHRTHWWLYEVR